MKITENVYMLDCTGFAHAYAVVDHGVTLIDTCVPGKGSELLAELKTYGIEPKNIKAFDSKEIGGISIIPAPGHTRGHSCFRYGNVLFAGDLIATKDGKVTPAPAIMTWNMKMSRESCKALDMTGIEWICPAHGDPVKGEAWAPFCNS